MSPRTGRPKADSPKSVEVKARIDEATNKMLIKHCKMNDITKTDVIRQGIDMVLGIKK